MSIIIWILSLFGINIGGGEEPVAKKYSFVPEGTVLVAQGVTYTGPSKVEGQIPAIVDGDTYTTQDYVYTFHANDADGSRFWSVVVKDKTKKAYQEIQTTTKIVDSNDKETGSFDGLFGANVEDLTSCYAGCTNLSQTPAIPSTVNIMVQTFKDCTSLVNPPQIPTTTIDMSGAFDGCENIQFPDGYKTYFKHSNRFYSYFTFNKTQQTWIANRSGAFGNANISNLNVYLNLIKSLNFEYAGYPIDVEYSTTFPDVCTLELYKTDSNSFVWKATQLEKCDDAKFDTWILEHKQYFDIPIEVNTTGREVEYIDGIGSLAKRTASNGSSYYALTTAEKSDMSVFEYFAQKKFQYEGTPVSLNGLTFNYNYKDVVFTVKQSNPCDADTMYLTAAHMDGTRYNSKLVYTLSEVEESFYPSVYYSNFCLFGVPISLKGISFVENDVVFTICQKNQLDPSTMYYKVAHVDGTKYNENLVMALSEVEESFLPSTCYNNYMLYGIPVSLDGISFRETSSVGIGITFTIYQSDPCEPDGKYYKVASDDGKRSNYGMMVTLSEVEKSFLPSAYYNNYRLYGIPVSLNGVSFELGLITFTVYQSNPYDADTMYYKVSADENDASLIVKLSETFSGFNVDTPYYNNYRLLGIPVSLNGLSVQIGTNTLLTLVQPDATNPQSMYFVPTLIYPNSSSNYSVDLFLSVTASEWNEDISRNFEYCGIPIKVDGMVLVASDHLKFNVHQDANDCTNVWLTIAAESEKYALNAFAEFKEHYSNGFPIDNDEGKNLPIKAEGFSIYDSSNNLTYIYHDATADKAEYFSVVVNVPKGVDKTDADGSFTQYKEYLKDSGTVETSILEVPVQILYMFEIEVLN